MGTIVCQTPGQNMLISFPLSKFSWASDPPTVNTSTWKHAVQNLVVVFDSFRSNEIQSSSLQSQMLKVVQGTKTLEFVDIGEKARMSKIVVDSTHRVGVRLQTEDIPCSAWHRRTACTIAIRYNIPDDYVRRIQLKLTSLQDFDAVLSILEKSGLNLIDSTPSAAVHDSRANGIVARSSATGHSVVPTGPAFASDLGSRDLSSSSDICVTASEDFRLINPPNTRMQSDDPSSETLHPSDPSITERPPSWRLDRPITSGPAGHRLSAQQHRPSTALPRVSEHGNATGPTHAGPIDLAYPHLDHPRPSSFSMSGDSHQQKLALHLDPTIHSFEKQRHDFSREPPSTLWGNTQGRAGSNQRDFRNSRPFSSHVPNAMNYSQRPSTALGYWPADVQVGKPDQVRPNTNHGSQTAPVQFVMPSTVLESSSNTVPDPPQAESFSSPLKDALERLRPYLDPISNEKKNLASYAALPNEERVRILEGQVIRLIWDESFVQLCEDLNACWQRIGLGI